MNYIIDLPEDLYYEILLYLQEKQLLIIFKVRRFKYKKLFSIKFPQLFTIINMVKNIDIRLKRYSYKELFHNFFTADPKRYEKAITTCDYPDIPRIYSSYYTESIGMQEILYAYFNIIKFPNKIKYLIFHEFPMTHNYLSGLLKEDNNLITEWMNSDYDFMYIDKKLDRDDYDYSCIFEDLYMNYLFNINNVTEERLISKYKELDSIIEHSINDPKEKIDLLARLKNIVKLERSIDL